MASPGEDVELIHVFPLFGLKHEISVNCWCHPEPDNEEPQVIVHNSMQ